MREEIKLQRGESFRLLLHQQIPGVWKEFQSHYARYLLVKLMRPLGAEVRVILTPDDHRRTLELPQPVQQVECAAMVLRVQLACQEALCFRPSAPIVQVRPNIALDQFGGQHTCVLNR